MEVPMFGKKKFLKATLVAAVTVLAVSTLAAAPAGAATKISNGVACTKSGATTKVAGYSYKCAKNSLKKNSKLTWLSVECLAAITSWQKAQKDSTALIAELQTQIPTIDKGIEAENAAKAEIAPKLADATSRLAKAQAMLAAAVTPADKKVLTSAVTSWTAAIRAYNSAIARSDAQIKKFQSSKTLAVSQGSTLTANVTDTKDNADLLCTAGL
jgi:hypothetical protein